jgi:Phage integrase family
MERSASVQQIGRLGFCKQTAPRPEANLGQAILRNYIRPVAQRVGIQKRFGWHTFRHTYATLLRSVGTEFKVMQDLLRHSSLRYGLRWTSTRRQFCPQSTLCRQQSQWNCGLETASN